MSILTSEFFCLHLLIHTRDRSVTLSCSQHTFDGLGTSISLIDHAVVSCRETPDTRSEGFAVTSLCDTPEGGQQQEVDVSAD
ncbi:unnamed protein product [Coregonus sp. 'balchen']|nr:unnamed protein product [Coregonus sp. 'balchen']